MLNNNPIEKDIRNNKDSFRWQSAAWVITALFAASIEPIIVKLGYRAAATPLQLLFIKSIVGGILILPLTRKFHKIPLKSMKRIITASLLFLGTNACVFLSLVHLTAIEVITITTTTPALVALVNQERGRDKLNIKFWLGFIMCFAGVLLTIEIYRGGDLVLSTAGLILAFSSVIGSTIYRTQMDEITEEVTPIIASSYLFLINAAIALFFIPWIGNIPVNIWGTGVWMGFAGAIANIAFLSAIYLLGSTRISIFTMLQRPVVIIATTFILKESLTLWQILGILMVIVGVQWAKVTRSKSETEKLKVAETTGNSA
jgi:drug/metabolite transporter (DMT)-like permease